MGRDRVEAGRLQEALSYLERVVQRLGEGGGYGNRRKINRAW